MTSPEHGMIIRTATSSDLNIVMETMIQWCREQGFSFGFLHASDAGRPLYEALGFEPTNEMRLKLR